MKNFIKSGVLIALSVMLFSVVGCQNKQDDQVIKHFTQRTPLWLKQAFDMGDVMVSDEESKLIDEQRKPVTRANPLYTKNPKTNLYFFENHIDNKYYYESGFFENGKFISNYKTTSIMDNEGYLIGTDFVTGEKLKDKYYYVGDIDLYDFVTGKKLKNKYYYLEDIDIKKK